MFSIQPAQAVLVDRRNFHLMLDPIFGECSKANMFGFDIETEDSKRHDGLNRFMNSLDPEEAKKNKKFVFDYNRTVITGFSLYPKGSKYVFYFNLAHADVENRLTFEEVKPILDLVNNGKNYQVVHNGPFEITMLHMVYGYELVNVICTLQMAVTAYGPDECPKSNLLKLNLAEAIKPLLKDIIKYFTNFDAKKELNPKQAEVVASFIGKSSKAKHSYNGIVHEAAYGYGLKKAIKSWFGYQMQTFEETLNGRAHMGQLTGEEVVNYGGDDAFWVIPLYDLLLQYMMETNPAAIKTFFEQENPMIYVYARATWQGIRVDVEQIDRALENERENYAKALQTMKNNIRAALTDGQCWPHEGVADGYASKEQERVLKSVEGTQRKILDWVNTPDSTDPYEMVLQVNGAVSETWWKERGSLTTGKSKKKQKTISVTHYYVVRVLLYDLLGLKPVVGRARKIESDGPARALLSEGMPDDSLALAIIRNINELGSIEQRMKLYINPYHMLTDPETSRMYPVLSSQLSTRRMAGQNPNFMQLAKSPEGAYVRQFFIPDHDEDVIVSLDWSQIELVLVGDQSGDPEFLRCYSQLPYEDLHKIAMATCYFVTEEIFDQIRKLPNDVTEYEGIKFQDKNGLPLSPKDFYKYARKEVGKVSNFNYWYSGALASVGEKQGWTSDQMWEATDAYRKKFAVAEQWRVGIQDEVARFGFITLPDNLRRVRYEATSEWQKVMFEKFSALDFAEGGDFYSPKPFSNFANVVLQKIRKRAANQAVNARIQGTCATLAKRSILRTETKIQRRIEECANDWRARERRTRFISPIHDELVYNNHRDVAVPFIADLKGIMKDHPDIVRTLPVDCTASVGLNFRPFSSKLNPIGQFELDEAQAVEWLDPSLYDKKLDTDHQRLVIDKLFEARMDTYGF
jgi:DNA polymerase I-like protein with 3'-5' exonuclease and polymerase domains